MPYRLLETVSHHGSSGSPEKSTNNLLIHGDNLEALKALMPFYRGRIKCIFIDPPYNTQSAFEHYDDKLEHSQWLSMMLPRLELLRDLLSEDGSIWVTIDDNEAHYLKVLMDEVFGRGGFVSNVIWQKRFSPNSTAIHLSDSHDHVLVYAKDKSSWKRNLLPRTEKADANYKNPDNDPRGIWTSSDLSARNFYSLGEYGVTTPVGTEIHGPPPGRYWTISKEKFLELDADNRIWWGAKRDNQPRLKRFLADVRHGVVPQTIWSHEDVGHTQEAKKEALTFNSADVFGTPKPERLMRRILEIATNPGDLVLDSFLGSGTTAAVAHKMGRRWIGIEMGEHALTHCLPRLQKVVAGEQGGISAAVGWGQGADGAPFDGGGFRLARLGAPVFGADGSIDPGVRFATLAAYIWQQETATAWDAGQGTPGTPYLGIHSVFDSVLRMMDAREGLISSEILEPAPASSPADTPDGTPAPTPTPVLRSRTAYYLLFNGILGDKRPAGGNVLTHAVLQSLLQLHAATPHPGAPLVVYGEACRLGAARLAQANVVFKHIPYDVKAR
ncbi:site-specific DNA-methyltransferase [Acidovorax sp. Q11]